MKAILQAALSAAVLAVAGCGGNAPTDDANTRAAPQPGLQPWTLPAGPGSAQPDLVPAPDGSLLLSWLEAQPGRRTRFQFARFEDNGHWDTTRTIAIGSSFFVNWADIPHILATPDGALWVQWLQKSGAAGAAYDVVLSNSRNDGMNWSAPVRPYADAGAGEHGFVSLWPQGNDRLGIAWLHGGSPVTSPSAGKDGHHDPAAATALRSAVFDSELRAAEQAPIDSQACDCCQTDVALTAKGPLLVYRDRVPDASGEIRDIASTRFDGRTWSASMPVAKDHWNMGACPVNGPSVAAQGSDVVVAWYTAANDQPTVKLARSTNAGDTYAAPVEVDQGEAVQGRVETALDAGAAWVLWVREDESGQSLWLARYTPDLSAQLEKAEVAKLQGRGHGTGFAQLALRDGRAYIVWTDVANGATALHGVIFVPKPL